MTRQEPQVGRAAAHGNAKVWAIVFLVCVVVPLWFLVTLGPLAVVRSDWITSVRGIANVDQLSYAAISSNLSHGHSVFVEPFTESGTLYYPAAYYVGLGVVARVLGIGIAASWNLIAAVFSLALVGAGAWWAFVTVRRWWAPVLALVPFTVGTLTWITEHDWGCACGGASHAVVWPAYAMLYPGNGEVAALVLGAIGIIIVSTDAWHRDGGMPTPWRAAVGFALIGLSANVHTYGFFMVLAAGLFVLWAVLLHNFGTRASWVTSFLLLLLAVLVGQGLSSTLGPTFAYAALAVPLVPGAVIAVRHRTVAVAAALAAAALTAAPQVVHTVLGLAGGDDFLAYRQSSGGGLTVAPLEALGAHLAVVALVLTVGVASWRAGHRGRFALAWPLTGAVALATVVMGWNDVWGFGQEPYRFLIDGVFLVLLIVPPLAIVTVRERLASPSSERQRLVVGSVAAATAFLLTTSLGGLALFWIRAQERVDWSEGKQAAARTIAARAGNGLVLIDPCISPPLWKMYTGGRVLFYNAGIAWPEHRAAVDAALGSVSHGEVTADELRRARATHVVSSSTCGGDLERSVRRANLKPQSFAGWRADDGSDESFTLWRVGR